MFGPNDFDETLPGPWEWDVKRMAASIEIAGRDIDLPATARRRIVERPCASTARDREFAGESLLDAWYARLDADQVTARFGTGLDAEATSCSPAPSRRDGARPAPGRCGG